MGLIAIAAAACSAPPVSYPDEIAAWRSDKDAYMRSSDSPVPAAGRAAFPALPYYPIDEQYRVPAALKVARGDDVIEMSTSTGKPRRMRRIGSLAFTLKGQPQTLTAFAEADDSSLRRLFVPFGDLTNGLETSQGGRKHTSMQSHPVNEIVNCEGGTRIGADLQLTHVVAYA